MNTKKLNDAIEVLKTDLGPALISCDIYPTGVGTPLVGYNSNPKAAALFDQVTSYIVKALDGSGFPVLNDYYLLELKNDNLVVVLLVGDYQWDMLIDEKKVNLGLLLNIALPNAKKALEEAIKA
jgi:hypothetical protein